MVAFHFATYARKLVVRLDTPLLRFVAREGSWDSSSIRPIESAKRPSGQRLRSIVIWARVFWRSSYHACLCHELELQEITYRSQVSIPLEYKGIHIAKSYVIDFLIEDCLVVELKSVDKLLPIHSAQLMTYLRLLRVSSGLLMNFNVDAFHHGIRRYCVSLALPLHPPCLPCFRGESQYRDLRLSPAPPSPRSPPPPAGPPAISPPPAPSPGSGCPCGVGTPRPMT